MPLTCPAGVPGDGGPGGTVTALLDDPAHRVALAAECARVMRFAEGSARADGGFGYLDAAGRVDPGRPVETYLTARMTHVFALGHLLGTAGHDRLLAHGVAALHGLLRDRSRGGWYAQARPLDDGKKAYDHAFVVLAASSAAATGRAGGRALLGAALDVVDRHFWSEAEGMVVEQWDRAWTAAEPYRGANASMHMVEAFLAAGDVTGDERWRRRALGITERLVHGVARERGWMLPEHYDARWRPLPDYNRDRPADPFRPYGVTVGHLLEWSRLALELRAALGPRAPDWLLADAVGLFDRAVEVGWDGAGFVYTVDFDGAPVVRQRMHWVVAEALGAAARLHRVTGDPRYDAVYARTWEHAQRHFADRAGGSWWHELGPDNRPAATTWPGKPDAYHVVTATLVPRLPAAPTIATALARGLLAP